MSFERFKFKFKLPYSIWLQLPLSLWLLMIGMELEAIILHVDWPSVLMSLLLQIERKTTFTRYYSKRQRFSTWIASRLNQLWTEAKRWFCAGLAATLGTRPRWTPPKGYQESLFHRRLIVRKNQGKLRAPKLLPLLIFSSIAERHNLAMAATTIPAMPQFDSDSYEILIDNCCSACISNEIGDFVGTPTPIRSRVSGIGGPLMVVAKGTIKWKIEDDLGQEHTLAIDPRLLLCTWSPWQIVVSTALGPNVAGQHRDHQRDLAGNIR